MRLALTFDQYCRAAEPLAVMWLLCDANRSVECLVVGGVVSLGVRATPATPPQDSLGRFSRQGTRGPAQAWPRERTAFPEQWVLPPKTLAGVHSLGGGTDLGESLDLIGGVGTKSMLKSSSLGGTR